MEGKIPTNVSTRNLILKSNDFANPHKQTGANTEVTSTNDYFVIKSTGYTANAWGGISWNMSISEVKADEEFSVLMPVYIDSSITLDNGLAFQIKNHSSNSSAYSYDIPTNKKDQWFNVSITFKAYKDVVFDTYPFYVLLVKNGLVRIKPPMLVRGNLIPSDYQPAFEDNIMTSVDTVNLVKGTGSSFVMGYGITNTTWNETKKQSILDFSVPGIRRDIGYEILPQENKFFDFIPIKGTTYTQSIMIDTDATFNPNGQAQCSWYTSSGHNKQKAYIKKVGEHSYQVWSTYTWNLENKALRAFDWYSLHNILLFRTTGTYLAFYKPKMTTGNLPSDWSPAPEDVEALIARKQDKLTAGTGIAIQGNVISATGSSAPQHDTQKEQVLASTRNTVNIQHGSNGTSETTKVDTNPTKVLEHDNLITDNGISKTTSGNTTKLGLEYRRVDGDRFNLNNLVNGKVRANDFVNAPSTGWLFVSSYSEGSYAIQEAIKLVDSKNTTYRRRKEAGVWGAWREQVGDKSVIDDISARVTSLDQSTVKNSSLTINSDGVVMKAGKTTTDIANAIGSYFAVNQNAINKFSDRINVKTAMIADGAVTSAKIAREITLDTLTCGKQNSKNGTTAFNLDEGILKFSNNSGRIQRAYRDKVIEITDYITSTSGVQDYATSAFVVRKSDNSKQAAVKLTLDNTKAEATITSDLFYISDPKNKMLFSVDRTNNVVSGWGDIPIAHVLGGLVANDISIGGRSKSLLKIIDELCKKAGITWF